MTRKYIVRKSFCLYLLVLTFFYIVENSYFPAWYDAFMQVFMLLMGLTVIVIVKGYYKRIFLAIFLFQLLCSFIMIGVNYEIYGDIYGYNPIDADQYRNYGKIFQSNDFHQAIDYLRYNNGIDDFGYPLIIFFAKKICGDYFLLFVIFLNALVVAIGSSFLYKLSSCFLSMHHSIITALVWGIMPFAVYTTAAGLKENFFVFFIILSIYYLYKYIVHKHLYLLCLFFLFTLFTFLFRLVVGYAIVLSFLSYIVFSNKFVIKYYKLSLVFIGFVIFFSFGVIADFVINQRGYEYEVLETIATERTGGIVGTIINNVAGFIGPIPNFVATDIEKLSYITRYSFTPFLKMMISFYFWYAVYYILKNKKVILIPMLVLYVVNISMLIFTYYTLHDRYQWPHIPMFLLLSAYGYMKSQQVYNIKRWYSYYLSVVLLIIIVFNFR